MTAKQAGAFVVGVTNRPHTPLTMQTDGHILVRATRVGWPTQASTAAISATLLLALELARQWDVLEQVEWQSLHEELHRLPGVVQQTIDAYDESISNIVQDFASVCDYFFVGGGPSFATAQFGAAKVKEYTLDHAVALELEEYHHYRSLKAGEPLFLVAPSGQSHDRAIETAQSARKANGQIFALIEEGDEAIASLADHAFYFPPVTEALTTIPYVVPLQLFADHLLVVKHIID